MKGTLLSCLFGRMKVERKEEELFGRRERGKEVEKRNRRRREKKREKYIY